MAKRVAVKSLKSKPKATEQHRSSSDLAASNPAANAQERPQPIFPQAPQPAAEAVALFERGMEAVQRRAYVEASRAFQAVLMGFPSERALNERARVYLGMCEREIEKKPVSPRTVEERLTAATAALNNNSDSEAEELVRNVLGDEPKNDHALYLLAAISARRGDNIEALALLTKVLAISPEASAQARADADFEDLHDMDDFKVLIEPPAPPDAPTRRGRRARTDR